MTSKPTTKQIFSERFRSKNEGTFNMTSSDDPNITFLLLRQSQKLHFVVDCAFYMALNDLTVLFILLKQKYGLNVSDYDVCFDRFLGIRRLDPNFQLLAFLANKSFKVALDAQHPQFVQAKKLNPGLKKISYIKYYGILSSSNGHMGRRNRGC